MYALNPTLTSSSTAVEVAAFHFQYPVLFGGNVGPGNLDKLNYGIIVNGNLTDTSTNAILYLIYQLVTQNVPSSLIGVLELSTEVVAWARGKLNPIFEKYRCPLVDTQAEKDGG